MEMLSAVKFFTRFNGHLPTASSIPTNDTERESNLKILSDLLDLAGLGYVLSIFGQSIQFHLSHDQRNGLIVGCYLLDLRMILL